MSRRRRTGPAGRPQPPPRTAAAPSEERPRLRRATIWFLVALAAVTIAAYAPVRHHELVSIDDPIYVSANPYLQEGFTWSAVAAAFTSTYANFWHPLTILSLMLDVRLFGMNPGALHLSNLLLHLVSTLVLFLALVRMTGVRGASAFVAALFAVHPLHVESVAWVAERKDVLSTVFWMLALWSYAGYARKPTAARYGLVLVLFALGLMAKPMLVTLPFVLLLLDVWPLGRVSLSADPARPGRWPGFSRAWFPLLLEKVPLLALAAASSVVAFFVQQSGGAVATLESFALPGRVANALIAYVAYILKMIWPSGLVVFYPNPQTVQVWPAAAAFVVLVAALLLVARFAARRPYLAVGWCWYLGTLLPVSGLLQVGSHAMADRYTYVPLIGLFIMVAWGVSEAVGAARGRRIALAAAAVLVVLACAVVTRAQVMTWRDSAALWEHTLRVMPDNYYAHNGIGLELKQQGRLDEAAAHFLRSAELAPGVPNALVNLGLMLAERGKTAEAIERYNEALRRAPTYPSAHVNLANALLESGRVEEAIAHFNEGLRVGYDPATARTGLGNALMAAERIDEAIRQFEDVLRIAPKLASAHYNLGNALQRAGRPAEAIERYREALWLEPGSADAHTNLAMALASMGRGQEALAEFTEAIRLEPDSEPAHTNLGTALLSMGKPADAVEQLQTAVRLKPDSAEAHMNLGSALFDMGRLDEALREHGEAVRLEPASADAHFNLAYTLQRAGRLPEAVAQYEATLRLEGESADVRIALGAALERLGRARDAVPHYREALRLKPDSAEARAGLARTQTAARSRRP